MMTDPPSRTSPTAARLIVAGLVAPFPFALPLGWLQNINFYIVGTLVIAYAISRLSYV